MKNICKLALAMFAVSATSQVYAQCGGVASANDVAAEYPASVTAGFTGVCEINGQDVTDAGTADNSSIGTATLDRDFLWVLDGKVNVCENTQRAVIEANGDNATYAVPAPSVLGATLTIESGTTIIGDSDTSRASNDYGLDYLVINRGCDIDAQGTSNDPIRMTSVQDLDTADTGARAQWGGLYVNGESPTNNLCDEDGEIAGGGEFCIVDGEANTGTHGGGDMADSSGTIRYLTVSYAGFAFSATSELNGIALQSVGSGTTVEYIQVNENEDDGIELFGGNVNVKNVVLTNNGDDGFDLTDGWDGNAQYVLVYNPDAGSNNRAFENNGGGGSPLSAGNFSNVTVISESTTVGDVELMRSREGNNGTYTNVAVVRPAAMAGECLDEDATSIWSSHYADCTTVGSAVGATAYTNSFNGYVNGFNEAILLATNPTTIDSGFEAATFVGAVENCENDWTLGWTIPGTLPPVSQAQCDADAQAQVNVPIMGAAGMLALFAGLASIGILRRRVY